MCESFQWKTNSGKFLLVKTRNILEHYTLLKKCKDCILYTWSITYMSQCLRAAILYTCWWWLSYWITKLALVITLDRHLVLFSIAGAFNRLWWEIDNKNWQVVQYPRQSSPDTRPGYCVCSHRHIFSHWELEQGGQTIFLWYNIHPFSSLFDDFVWFGFKIARTL